MVEEADMASLTPLEREILHSKQEEEGILQFPVVWNDCTDASVTMLLQLKAVFVQQLPKMPRDYVSRLVLDRQHVSLACTFHGEVVGGITYRPVFSQNMAEIVFCAVHVKHQVQGYGTRIMNQIKEQCKRDGIEGMLTYADNHAVGYFRKQGFKKQVTMKRERWQGYLKDYEGATLMECIVDPTIDYLSTRQIMYRGVPMQLQQVLDTLFESISNHEDAWPFQHAVSSTEAPDYYDIVKNPIDMSMIRTRLHRQPPYYVTPDQLLSDLYVMFENCRLYNPDTTVFWECATRLEAFTRNRRAELEVGRRPNEDRGSAAQAGQDAPSTTT